MGTDDWNFLLMYAEEWDRSVDEKTDARHKTVLVRFKQWCWENDISIPN